MIRYDTERGQIGEDFACSLPTSQDVQNWTYEFVSSFFAASLTEMDGWGFYVPVLVVALYPALFAFIAFILGACIGSFLNVCIYRMPRNLSVNEPRRSFCPSCKYQIPWSSNLPLVTWIFQGGKCKNCKSPISVRYVLVELLTGLLFLAVWLRQAGWTGTNPVQQWAIFLPWVVFISLLVVATFIDFEFFIIPDEITIGGTVAGIVFSLALPQMHGQPWGTLNGHLLAGMWAAIGAAIGFVLLWVVSVLGKLAFGRKSKTYDTPQQFEWVRQNDEAHLTVGTEKLPWIDLFSTEKDVLVMDCVKLEIQGSGKENYELRTRYEHAEMDGGEIDLNKVDRFAGVVRKISWKRDAMGFGDVKFIACIGAFLGWQAVLFIVMAASVIGAIIGGVPLLISRLTGKDVTSPKIPFGPYLSLAALLWMFAGPEIVAWYVNLVTPLPPL